jgi:peptidylprolyl isomerase
MKRWIVVAGLALAAPSFAQEAEPPTPASVVAAAKPEEWAAIDPADLLVMELAPDAAGARRTVVIQLMPAPFSQGWVGNIRTLAKAHWWDGTTVYRVVDNWVAQWGDGEDDEAKAKPLPEGLLDTDGLDYVSTLTVSLPDDPTKTDPKFTPLPAPDPYVGVSVAARDPQVSWVGGLSAFSHGWPVALAPASSLEGGEDLVTELTGLRNGNIWPVHCYASVGVARNLSPDTGTGAELYAVIGHAPRQLDRNIAVVGRVIEGIEHLSTLRRGKGEAGVYDDPRLRVPIVSARLGSELPEPPRFQYLASESASFAEYVRVRANRNDSFYKVPAGGIDVCNVQVPIRRVPAE